MRTRLSPRPVRAAGLAAVGCAACAMIALAGARSDAQASQPGTPTAIPASRGQWGPSFGGERVFTQPKQDASMGFTLTTQVMEVTCRAGDRVTAGQLLIRGDDREEASRYAQQVHRAESMLQIERARAAAALAKVEYENNLDASQRGGATQLEVDRARLSMDTANIDVQIAEWSQQQERYLADLTQARVDRFRLVAPFDGVIDVVNVDTGDSVRESDPVVRVVDLSELWIDVPTSPDEVSRLGLTVGSQAWVLIELADRPAVAAGRVLSVSPTADFGSSKQRVRVAVDNASAWPAGLAAWVRFTQPSPEWSSLIAVGPQTGVPDQAAGDAP